MPPVRKKIATNNNHDNFNSKINNFTDQVQSFATGLKLDDLVLAKVNGFPAWPAKVSRPEDWERTPDPKKYFVQFFGTQEIAFVAPANIQAFTSESKTKLLDRCKGKTVKYFNQAVKEICVAFEELQKRGDIKEAIRLDVLSLNDDKINESHIESTNVLKSEEPCQIISVSNRAYLFEDLTMGDKQTNAMKDSTADRHGKSKLKRESDCFSPSHVQNEGKKSLISAADRHEKVKFKKESYSFSPGHVQNEDKKVSIGATPKDLKVGTKRKVEGVICHADPKSGLSGGNDAFRKLSGGEHAKRLASNLNKFELNSQAKGSKSLSKGPNLSNAAKSSLQNLVTSPEGHLDGRHLRQKNSQTGSEQSLSVKKATLPDRMSGATKGSVPKNEKKDLETEMVDGEAIQPAAKSRYHALDAVYNGGKRNLSIASLSNEAPKRRRAVRLCDDDNDNEPKTPVHRGSMKYGSTVSSSISASDSAKTNEKNESSIPIGKSSLDAILSQKVDSSTKANLSQSPGLNNQVVQESKTGFISPLKSPQVVASIKKSVEPARRFNEPFNRVTSSGHRGKVQVMLGKDQNSPFGEPISSQNQVSSQKSRKPISSEGARISPRAGVMMIEPAAFDNSKDHAPESEKILEDIRDKSGPSADSKASEKSMKNLIAQAKRRHTRLQNVPSGGGDAVMAPSANHSRRIPSQSSTSLAVHSGKANVTQHDGKGVESHGSFSSPSLCAVRAAHKEREEKEPSLGIQSAGSALSGGTEILVVRDAFKGMIETLSRTKESIGRATRLAIDCAKYGIANEVVDLLLRKLENESNLHHKVDLFFLVDSITQCSHSQKGIAGASYLPTVQAVLPRILDAAAPAGPNARENRRQCLKVLRLWLERKILPEPVLRRFIDGIEGLNDETSNGISFKRPSKANRSVDDPIREMEGMFVDEYGSNATFNLPGFLSTHGFIDDDEDEDDFPSSTQCRSESLPLQACSNGSVGPETVEIIPSDRCHRILEDVDGELETEDVSENHKDGALSHCDFLKEDEQKMDTEVDTLIDDVDEQERQMDTEVDTLIDNVDEQDMQMDTEVDTLIDNVDEVPSFDGSPPLPPESPPPLPPLPSSPPPPPLPPSSPSPPPPPPPPPPLPVSPLSQPSMPSLLPLGPPQAGNLQPLASLQLSEIPQAVLHPPAKFHWIQMAGNTSQEVPRFVPSLLPLGPPQAGNPQPLASLQLSEIPQVVLHPPAKFHSLQEGHAVQMAGNTSQEVPRFVPVGESISRPLKYGEIDMYPAWQAGPLNQQFQQHQQFQPPLATFGPRAFPPPSLPQPPLGSFIYNKPLVQQHLPHPHSHLPAFPPPPSHPYSSSNSEGLRRVNDEQWRPTHVEYKGDNHHNTWVSGARVQSFPTTTFSGEAYFRPPEMAPTNNLGHHASAPNSSNPSGPNQMLPSRPDVSLLNHWRPV